MSDKTGIKIDTIRRGEWSDDDGARHVRVLGRLNGMIIELRVSERRRDGRTYLSAEVDLFNPHEKGWFTLVPEHRVELYRQPREEEVRAHNLLVQEALELAIMLHDGE